MKYNCRECPKAIRDLCIQECNEAPSIRIMMRRAFDAGTDSQEMWRRLQMNCLRLRREQEGSKPTRRSLLSQRLSSELGAAEVGRAQKPPLRPAPAPAPLSPEARSPIKEPQTSPLPAQERQEETGPIRYGLVPQQGQHRIALPMHGEIVLGRFDLATRIAPDVDLSYDDRESYAISRRHARIVCSNGRHEIEDMGSTNGTKINGVRLVIGQKVRLRLGDRVTLGHCEFVYTPIPEMPVSLRDEMPSVRVWVAFTGQRFPLPRWGEVVIGRSDLSIGLVPDIDLSDAGEAAQVVARRHVKIVARGGRHYVEDLGSANGTRVNGVAIKLSELRLLSPGDHLWLGGCVLVYDVEPLAEKADSRP
ncbi:MAG TPA: FHA domain-containing protein [Chloroflexi bacterium]|nr:FHA domain-containing protein [Chloroflexota bacterium]